MILIIGGAYQGKLEFAKETFGITDSQICLCGREELDFSRPCIAGLEEFVRCALDRGEDPVQIFKDNRQQWSSSILICRDISCGVVPLNREDRRWRQATGRLCQYLAGEADQVSRIFCGLEQRLK